MFKKNLKFELISNINKFSDNKTKIWWENYVKHETKFRGVGIPKIRELLKDWYIKNKLSDLPLNEQFDLALSFFEGEYSEDKLAGILFLQYYLHEKLPWKIQLNNFEKIFDKGLIYDWNICDWFCVRVLGSIIKKNGLVCAKAVSSWSSSKNLWKSRASIVAFANLVSEKDFLPLIFNSSLVLIKRNERFAKTAVGWLMREISKNDKKHVEHFIRENFGHFSKESLKNATKYFDKKERENFK